MFKQNKIILIYSNFNEDKVEIIQLDKNNNLISSNTITFLNGYNGDELTNKLEEIIEVKGEVHLLFNSKDVYKETNTYPLAQKANKLAKISETKINNILEIKGDSYSFIHYIYSGEDEHFVYSYFINKKYEEDLKEFFKRKKCTIKSIKPYYSYLMDLYEDGDEEVKIILHHEDNMYHLLLVKQNCLISAVSFANIKNLKYYFVKNIDTHLLFNEKLKFDKFVSNVKNSVLQSIFKDNFLNVVLEGKNTVLDKGNDYSKMIA